MVIENSIMRDFIDLESQVKNGASKKYLHEAIAALGNDAKRSALVSLWTAVTLDIIWKIRHLADGGDKEAIGFVKDLDRTIDSGDVAHMQKIESGLLSKARQMEIISSRQMEELERLHKDRNLCAHPAFVSKGVIFNPSVELVRSHIATAVDSCLCLPAITGRQVLQLFEEDLSSDICLQ